MYWPLGSNLRQRLQMLLRKDKGSVYNNTIIDTAGTLWAKPGKTSSARYKKNVYILMRLLLDTIKINTLYWPDFSLNGKLKDENWYNLDYYFWTFQTTPCCLKLWFKLGLIQTWEKTFPTFLTLHCLLVFDVTKMSHFSNYQYWMFLDDWKQGILTHWFEIHGLEVKSVF